MTSDANARLGFVGLGAMGAPMVGIMGKSGRVPTLFDIDAALAKDVAARNGASSVPTLAALGAACDVVILMLPNSAIVRQVVLGSDGQGSDGLAASMAKGGLIIDMSSSDPVETRRLGAEIAQSGITLMDAPVSGGVRKAANGTLAIMLGTDDDAAAARATPVLESMGTVYRTGGLGSGHATKALNNYVSAAGLSAACEAVLIGKEFGLDPDRLVEVINASTGRNNATENKLRQFVLNDEFRKAGFSLALMAKDLGLAASLAEATRPDLPGPSATRDLWAAARDRLEDGADHTEIYRYLDSMADPSEAGDGKTDDRDG